MSLLSVVPNLMVYDVDKTIDFYEKVLGFILVDTVPKKFPFDWAIMKKDEVTLMFQSKKSLSGEIPVFQDQKPGGGVTLYIKTNNIDALYEKIKDQTEIVADLEHTFYGTKEFSIIDLNSYVLTFAQEIQIT